MNDITHTKELLQARSHASVMARTATLYLKELLPRDIISIIVPVMMISITRDNFKESIGIVRADYVRLIVTLLDMKNIIGTCAHVTGKFPLSDCAWTSYCKKFDLVVIDFSRRLGIPPMMHTRNHHGWSYFEINNLNEMINDALLYPQYFAWNIPRIEKLIKGIISCDNDLTII